IYFVSALCFIGIVWHIIASDLLLRSHAAPWATEIQGRLDQMTSEEKIGQLFMVHVYGADINDRSSANVKGNRDVYGLDTIAEVIRTYKPGGVIYFQWTDNLHDLDQIARLSKDLQQLSLEATGTPLLIGIDQEHGVV